jgi:hypothetical protein
LLSPPRGDVTSAARYIVQELAGERVRVVASATADSLCRGMLSLLDDNGSRRSFEDELTALEGHVAARLAVARAYMQAFVGKKGLAHVKAFVLEAAVILVTERAIEREPSAATVEAQVEGLLGSHSRIVNRSMKLAIDDLLSRVTPRFLSNA